MLLLCCVYDIVLLIGYQPSNNERQLQVSNSGYQQ